MPLVKQGERPCFRECEDPPACAINRLAKTTPIVNLSFRRSNSEFPIFRICRNQPTCKFVYLCEKRISGAHLENIAIDYSSFSRASRLPESATAATSGRPAPLTAAECKCSIEITVKRHGSGAPLGDVGIVATYTPPVIPSPDGVFRPGTPSPVTLNATTDDSGHVIFSNLEEGSYSIRAQREGFFGSVTDAFPSAQAFASVAVGPAPANRDSLINSLQVNAASRGGIDAASIVPQPVQHVTIEMIPGGVISGRIQDANHRPAAGIAVIPFQVRYQYGRRTLQQTSTQVQTDDLGQFRLFWFAPGEYYIRTMIPPVQAARGGGPNFPSPTYFPGTLDAARATPIVIHEGEEYNSADFELQTVKGVQVSGTVINTLPAPVVPRGTQLAQLTATFWSRAAPELQSHRSIIPNAVPPAAVAE